MNKPKKHHFVPRTYLNEYSNNKDFFCLDLNLVLERKKVVVRPKSSGQVCYFNDFYLIQNIDYFDLELLDKYHIELKAFNRLENSYRDLVRYLLENQSLGSDQSIGFSDFILQMKIRNPFFLKVSEYNKKRTIEMVKSNLFNDICNNDTFNKIPTEIIKASIDQYGDKIILNQNFIKNMQLKQILDKTNPDSYNIKKFRESMLDCKWILLDSKNCVNSFFTSDNPGISLSKTGILENTKFSQGFKFYFPLNGRFCLFFSDENKDYYFKTGLVGNKHIEVFDINKYELEFINSLLVPYYNKYIFSNSQEELTKFGTELL